MMNSVGAERDPYLQAYIQARMKNHVEEVKLQKILANLEVGRRIKKIILNMELYEDRKMAHKLKQEASDLEVKKKKAMQKLIRSSNAAAMKVFATKSGYFRPAHSYNPSATTQARDANTAPPSGIKRLSVFPVTKGNTRPHSPENTNNGLNASIGLNTTSESMVAQDGGNSQMLNSSINSRHHREPDPSQVQQPQPPPAQHHQTNHQQHHVSIVVNETGSSNGGRIPPAHTNNHPDNMLPHSQPRVIHLAHIHIQDDPTTRIRRRSSAIPHLPHTSAHGEVEGMKTPATIPMRNPVRALDARSVRTLPNLHMTEPPSKSPSRVPRPKTSTLWPGDPCAIRSVRRERRKPEEMLSLVKNGEEARRIIREAPASCSKNCSKPDILQELGRSYSDLPNLLPAIEKARHELAIKEAASRELLESYDRHPAKEEPLPVSQIQYLALRSLGGVRRNSVIV